MPRDQRSKTLCYLPRTNGLDWRVGRNGGGGAAAGGCCTGGGHTSGTGEARRTTEKNGGGRCSPGWRWPLNVPPRALNWGIPDS